MDAAAETLVAVPDAKGTADIAKVSAERIGIAKVAAVAELSTRTNRTAPARRTVAAEHRPAVAVAALFRAVGRASRVTLSKVFR